MIFSALGGLMGASTAQQGGAEAAAASKAMYQTGLSDSGLSTWIGAGQKASGATTDILGLTNGQFSQGANVPISGQLGMNAINRTTNPFDTNEIGKTFQSSPGYNFQVDQGTQAMNASAAARGGLLSGAAVKAGATFNQGLANQDYWNYVGQQRTGMQADYAQRSDAYNRISHISDLGEDAGKTVMNAAVTSGGQQASAISSAANTAAGALQKGFSGMASSFGSFFS